MNKKDAISDQINDELKKNKALRLIEKVIIVIGNIYFNTY